MPVQLAVLFIVFSAISGWATASGELYYVIAPAGLGAYVMIDPARNTHPCMGDGQGDIICRW